jgi:hypothetical protein
MGQILEFLRPADAFDSGVVEALGKAYDMAFNDEG